VHRQDTGEDALVITIQKATKASETGNAKDFGILDKSLRTALPSDEFFAAFGRSAFELGNARGSHLDEMTTTEFDSEENSKISTEMEKEEI
jgi:hypothetical protein